MQRQTSSLSFWYFWNISFGCFGIQFGWNLQMANMSAIFEYLGANAHQLPLLWLAAPLTGLIVQPIIGYMSDHTWTPLGRRRPYFLGGAILSSIALVLMPNVSTLWMAAGLLWILDASVNISMEPFRAFIGDSLPSHHQTRGFAMQSFFIGLGAVIAASFPWILAHGLHLTSQGSGIPMNVKVAFYTGAVVFLGSVIWTVLTTTESPPDESEISVTPQNLTLTEQISRFVQGLKTDIQTMPAVMKQLAWVQFFTWLGMFCFFLYFPPTVARNVFLAPDQHSPLYTDGIEWAGLCIALYNGICFLFAFMLPQFVKATRRGMAHSICLACGGLSLMALWFVQDRYGLLVLMVGVGIAWCSILTIPYAMLMDILPRSKRGIYTGIFNFFIVIPQVIASLGLGWLMVHVFQDNRLIAVVSGGVAMLIAAIWMQFVDDGVIFPSLQGLDTSSHPQDSTTVAAQETILVD